MAETAKPRSLKPQSPKHRSPIAPGKPAPAFTLVDQHGKPHTLADYQSRPVVLFFYPKDLTSGCTDEACQFRDLLPRFKRSKAAVFGVSILGPKSKAKFAEKEGLTYPLLADDRVNENKKPDPAICQKYGVWVEKSMYGKKYMGIARTTYLIDANGKVAKRWDKVKVPGHAEEVLEAVKAF
ncbi:MAG: peroxiredoxin Q/BCP [Phycisphaerales bacterium]|jgi:peroxiredoxin Q/BCP